MKGRRTRVRVDDKNAVAQQRVTMQIEVACGAKTLQGYDCPRLGLVEASEAQLSFGSVAQPSKNFSDENPQGVGAQTAVVGGRSTTSWRPKSPTEPMPGDASPAVRERLRETEARLAQVSARLAITAQRFRDFDSASASQKLARYLLDFTEAFGPDGATTDAAVSVAAPVSQRALDRHWVCRARR
jgi:hypothetical protein